MNRAELLKFDGTPRPELERRIRVLAPVLDAASALIDADDAATDSGGSEEAEERYEQAWDTLRAELAAFRAAPSR